MMVVAAPISEPHHQNHLTRPPFLPSDHPPPPPPPCSSSSSSSRRPKSREVTSRYLSSSCSTSSSSSSASSRRCASPSPSLRAGAVPATPLRSQSATRRRPGIGTPIVVQEGNSASTAAAKILITSTRSLSVSFQGESFSLPISKTKAAPTPVSHPVTPSLVRKGTPERRRPTPVRNGENFKPEQQPQLLQNRWPGRARQDGRVNANSVSSVNSNPLSRSLDCTVEKKRGGSGSVARALQNSMVDEGRRRLQQDSSRAEMLKKSIQLAFDVSAVDPVVSDTDSVSSSNSGDGGGGGVVRGRSGARGISVPARFWQETNSRLRRLHDPTSPSSRMAPQKIASVRKSVESPVLSPRQTSRGMASPLRGGSVRPVSPSKLSPSRGNASPARVRSGVAGAGAVSQLSGVPSIGSFPGRGKMGESQIADAHVLRLLYNRHLQWRFVSAKADANTLMQRHTTEKTLYNAWITTSELRDSVTIKRTKLQSLRQKLKLTSVLKGQMKYLEEWGFLDRDHSSSLSGAIEALEASTLRLPVVGGAKADIVSMKDAVSSAVDVMQAMTSSIFSSLSKAQEANTLVTELANVTSQERALLDQGKDILSTLAAMQVTESSLRTHIIQLKRAPKQEA